MKTKISALFLSLLMVFTLGATAFAADAEGANTEPIANEPPPMPISIEAPDDSATSSDELPPVSTPSDADAPVPAELPTSSSKSITTPNQYNITLVNSSYDDTLDALVLEFTLTDAGKIELLCEHIYPAYRLEEETAMLERLLSADHLMNDLIYSGQKKPLKEMLYPETAAKITAKMDALEIMKIVRDGNEHVNQSPAWEFVEKYQNSIDNTTAELRRILSKLYAMRDITENPYVMTAEQLLTFAKTEAAAEEFQKFMEVIKPLLAGNRDAKSLCCRFNETEISEHYAKLAAVAHPYWGDYITWIEEMRLQMYIPRGILAALGSTAHNAMTTSAE